MLKYQAGAGELCHLARLSHCTIMADRTSRDASSAGQQLPCSQQPSSSPHIPPDQLLISSSTVTQKPSSHFWFLEVSPRLKCCAIQQMNLLFSFLSLLSYGFQLNIIEAGSWFAVWAIWRRISFFVIMPRRRPLCVTRHCLKPNFRKISTTISIGVWSVTVKGLMSSMLLSFKGRGLSAGSDGVCWAKQTLELPTIPSCFFLALSLRGERGKEKKKKKEQENLHFWSKIV